MNHNRRNLSNPGLLSAILLPFLLLLSACGSGDDPIVEAVPLTTVPAEDALTEAGESDGNGQAGTAEDGQTSAQGADGQAATAEESPPLTGSLVDEVGEVLVETGEGLQGEDLELYLARRYEAYWQAFDLARQAPTANPSVDYPALATLVAGEQLDNTYAELVDLTEQGHAIREPEEPAVPGLDANSAHRVRIETLESGVAELMSCLVNDNVRVDVNTGDVISQQVITVQTRTTMARADGTWKVIRSTAVGLEQGVAGCWLEPEDSFPL